MSTTLNYNYASSGGQPGSGQAYQAASAANLLSLSNIDNDGGDNTVFLGAVAVNDTIEANGVTWIVENVLIKGSNVQYTVSPAAQAPPFGVTAFTFAQLGVSVGYEAIIQAGESLSNAVDVKGVGIVMIMAPLNWTAANISFRVSDDNVTFFDLMDIHVQEVQRMIKPGCAIMIDPVYTQSINYVKIRSGSRDGNVVQQTDSVLTLIAG
jgi:hypothetical protein